MEEDTSFTLFFLGSIVTFGAGAVYYGLHRKPDTIAANLQREEVAMFSREGEERGRGNPLSDVERIARHYDITTEEACEMLRDYSVEDLVPERGYGLAASPSFLAGTSETDLASCLNTMENSLDHGGQAKLQLATYDLPTKEDLNTMWADMVVSGFHVSKLTATVIDGVPVTSMVLTKGSPAWAALLPLIVPLCVIGLIAFGITKIETITRALMPLVLSVGLLTVISLGIMRQPAIKAAEKYASKK